MDPKYVRIIAVVVVVVVVVAGLAVYFTVARSSASKGCALKSTNPLVVDQAETTGTADPQWATSTPDWGLAQQVYQTLVMYNGSSLVTFTGVLAKNWTVSKDGFHYNFTLRSGVHFSNGDPLNAYVMWFSLYRTLAMVGIDQYLLSENFWYPGVYYYNTSAQNSAALVNLTNDLNTFNFVSPTAAQLAVMEAKNQSFQVINSSLIEVNPGFGYLDYTPFSVPYTYLLPEISTPGWVAVDPTVLRAHGGVAQSTNAWMTTNAVGTGPFLLTSYNSGTGYTITPDPNYWGKVAAVQEPWNNNIQPAKSTIQVNFQSVEQVTINDLKSGGAAIASFAYNAPSAVNQLKGTPCLTVQALDRVAPGPFSGASGSWWVFMNQSVFPFNNLNVRAAIVHAINYSQVITDAFGGYASEWVGPVPPGHPYYNPANIPPYQYNLALAKQEIQSSPCANNACASTVFNYMYLNTGTDWADAATVIQSNLKQIGISIAPVGITLPNFYSAQTIDPTTHHCVSASTSFGGPFFIGQDFYASDYISPDDWTQQDALSYGSANICNSGYFNATMDALVIAAAGEHNITNLTRDYTQMTQLMYTNYTDAWFAVPTLFAVYNSAVAGLYQTPMGSTALSTMGWNTVYTA